MVGDLPFADVAPPENVLFVCKLNQVTKSEDLELIFSRFGTIMSCEIICDQKTGDSLQYAFIEFKEREEAERAYVKMDNVLVDDRRIHVDFSQVRSFSFLSLRKVLTLPSLPVLSSPYPSSTTTGSSSAPEVAPLPTKADPPAEGAEEGAAVTRPHLLRLPDPTAESEMTASWSLTLAIGMSRSGSGRGIGLRRIAEDGAGGTTGGTTEADRVGEGEGVEGTTGEGGTIGAGGIIGIGTRGGTEGIPGGEMGAGGREVRLARIGIATDNRSSLGN